MDLTATTLFSRLSKAIIPLALLVGILLMWGGCWKQPKDVSAFGRSADVTESVYHRLKAGIFQPDKDPFVYQIVKRRRLSDMKAFLRIKHSLDFNVVPYGITRVSWERGSFRVRADDRARVVVYMDQEALLSHVQLSSLKHLGSSLQFREFQDSVFR